MSHTNDPVFGEASDASADIRPGIARQLGLRQSDALLIIDVQRDFLPGGALGIAGADSIIAPINAYVAAFESRRLPIFFTRDWHPDQHVSFTAAGGPWPPHCIRGTHGARWAEGLHVVPSTRIISKGTDAFDEGYSGFSQPALLTILRDLGIRRLFVGGLATDYCVRATVLDARANGFEVVLLADAIRGVDAKSGDAARALQEMLAHGATLASRSDSPGSNAEHA